MPTHGKAATYRRHGCRCLECTAANTEEGVRAKERRIQRGRENPDLIPHGYGGYVNWACRCLVCTAGNTQHSADQEARRKQAREQQRRTPDITLSP